MTRTNIFKTYKSHAWFKKLFKKLHKEEVKLCLFFLQSNAGLSKGDFERAVNRLFLDNKDKPTNWPIISELLTCANSAFTENQ